MRAITHPFWVHNGTGEVVSSKRYESEKTWSHIQEKAAGLMRAFDDGEDKTMKPKIRKFKEQDAVAADAAVVTGPTMPGKVSTMLKRVRDCERNKEHANYIEFVLTLPELVLDIDNLANTYVNKPDTGMPCYNVEVADGIEGGRGLLFF